MKKIPRIMSTQHPDNVSLPFFANSQNMSESDELQEVYYVFSHLGCDEQMWDHEGKESDNFIIRKLLTKYGEYFQKNELGKELFFTIRVPNPDVEKSEAKILLEILESIPRSCDAARTFYGKDTIPIFEVILPVTTSSESLNRIYHYYKDFVVGKENKSFYQGDLKISDWIGKFEPKNINVIPLFEDIPHQLEADKILKEYLKNKNVQDQRIFLARSDTAMNHGMIGAILCNRISLQKLNKFSKEYGIGIYPILGVGSAPFRGHLNPNNVDSLLKEYPDVQTFTVQSAFKYDYPVLDTISAIKKLQNSEMIKNAKEIDEKEGINLINKTSIEYKEIIKNLAPIINKVASFVPKRRMRKPHIGLFGYSRKMDEISLPRAISFVSACYSIGLPPEIFGLNALNNNQVKFVENAYQSIKFDIQTSMSFFNKEVLDLIPKEIVKLLKLDLYEYKTNEEHQAITSKIIRCIKENKNDEIQNLLVEASRVRKFLG